MAGTSVHFNCRYVGIAKWLKNNQSIPEDSGVMTGYTPLTEMNWLTIKLTQYLDTGTYTCVYIQDYIMYTASANLYVTGLCK